MTDAVYILGSGSLAGNEEIKLSIRSLWENMLDLGKVYVVGEYPTGVPGAVHVQCSDFTNEKWKNAYHKVSKACSIAELSEEFVLMNDDFFLLEPFKGEDMPFYALKGSNGGSCGQHSYHVHCPIRIHKEMYQKMPFSVDQKACRSPRTFYANFYGAPPKFIDDPIMRVGTGMREPDVQIKGLPFFSIGDSAMLHPPFVDWLRGKYPTPSPFEA